MTHPIDRRGFLQTTLRAGLFSALPMRDLLTITPDAPDPVKLAAGGLELEFQMAADKPTLWRSLRNARTGFEWARVDAPVEPVLVARGRSQSGWTWRPHVRGRTAQGERLEAGSAARDPGAAPLAQATLGIQAVADLPFVEWRAELLNADRAPTEGVERFGPIQLTLRPGTGPLRFYAFPKNAPPKIYDIPAADAAGNRSFEPVVIEGGYSPSPGGAYGGLVLLEAVERQEFLIFGLEWDLGLHGRLAQTGDAITLTLNVGGLSHTLAPGEGVPVPAAFVGVTRAETSGDFEHALNLTREYLKRHVFPKQREDMPWVVYNIWGTEPSGVEETIRKEIDVAAKLGVEMLYVDASWYKGSSKTGTGDWGCGLGNYEEDREKFPAGLAAMSRAVHAAGMKFGLWVAPHTVDSRLIGPLIRERWLVDPNNGPGFTADGWEIDVRGVCLACPEYFEYVRRNLLRIVKEYELDWFKWDDSPGIRVCSRADHGHQAGDGLYHQMRNKYLIFEELHRTFPKLVIEQCATTLDYATARVVRANWLSDSTYPSSAVRRNAFAGSYIYPSAYNGAWIVQVDPAFAELAKSDVRLDTAYRSRMLGAFGFGTLTGKLSERVSLYPESVLAAARRNIPVYKRYRHLLAQDCYHLARADGSAADWEAIEFVARDGREAVVLTFRGKSPNTGRTLRPRGLTPTATYEVTSVNTGGRVRRRGDQLLRDGVAVTLAEDDMSEVLLLKRV